MIKRSVIIPTAFAKCRDLLQPCLESIITYTTLVETEVVVVSNGSTDNTNEYVASLHHPNIRLISFPRAMGYSRAINAGIKAAHGEFIVPLNNDTVLSPQGIDDWIRILEAPFSDPKVAISGPWKNWCPYAGRDFLIFFVVMIRRSVLPIIGMLDEQGFGMGYGEDCDLCCKAEDAGFKVVQVPDDTRLVYDGVRAVGNFPIWHKGNETFRNWPGGERLLAHNRQILKERYGVNIEKAQKLDGWMSDAELTWLAERAQKSKVFVQVGAWHGKSSRAIADNLPPDGKFYDVDKWTGSQAEQDSSHWSARLMEGDHAFDEYARGMWDHLASGKVTALKMHGKNGAKLLQDMGIKADTVFIDGGHDTGETAADIGYFHPLVKKGGILCGHDYMHGDGMWPAVGLEVKAIFGQNVGHVPATSIWFTDAPPAPHKPDIYDCFLFNNELDILERRLQTISHVVDRHIIVEATKTHSGKPKELVFQNNLERFRPYLHKISYIMVDDFPVVPDNATVTDRSWAIERHQRDAIMRGLEDAKDNDIIIISDCDEIPNPWAITGYNPENGMMSFEMTLYYYNMDTPAIDKWYEAKVLPFKYLKNLTPCGARYSAGTKIPNGGMHLSYFGSVQDIIHKIENTAHQEYNKPEYKDPTKIQAAILKHQDLFGRPQVRFA